LHESRSVRSTVFRGFSGALQNARGASERPMMRLLLLPIRALLSLPYLIGFLLVGWLYLRDVRKGRGR